MKKLFFLVGFLFLSFNRLVAHNYRISDIFTIQQGLSSSKINSVVQDEQGFIWIGTEDGLNRFDGVQFAVYKMNKDKEGSLNNNYITALFKDKDNRLWIATAKGLHSYDRESDTFLPETLSLPDYVVKQSKCIDILQDRRGYLWLAIADMGVVRYDPEENVSQFYYPSHTRPDSTLCSLHIRNMSEDSFGRIWISSEDKGISVFNPMDESFTNYNTTNTNLPVNSVFSLCSLENGDMMIGTLGGGIGLFNASTGKFNFDIRFGDTIIGIISPGNISAFSLLRNSEGELLVGTEGYGMMHMQLPECQLNSYLPFLERKYEVGDSKIQCMYEDKKGNIWVGMPNNGLCLMRKNIPGLNLFKKVIDNPNSLKNSRITGITNDRSGNIWFATDGSGIIKYEPVKDKYHVYCKDITSAGSLPDDAIVCVFCDSKGRVWVGTYMGGLCLYNPVQDNFRVFKHDSSTNSIPSNFVRRIEEDVNGRLWIATNGGGLSCFEPERGIFTNYSFSDYINMISDYISNIFICSAGKIWIGTYSGLSCLDPETNTFVSFMEDPELNYLIIHSITEDQEGRIWVGTTNGLKVWDEENQQFKDIPLYEDSFNRVINGIINYNDHLLLSTNKEIISYSPAVDQINWILRSNDISNNEFLRSSYYKSPDGMVFFGGNAGCCSFFPDSIQLDNTAPDVYLSSFKIFNDPVAVGEKVNGRVILTKNISLTDKIVLKHSHKSFTIDFTAPQASFPSSTIYSCFMKGFDKEWTVFENNQRSVTYTNFSPGTYIFHVKASNSPDKWDEKVTTLTIEILPPVWATWWVYLAYLILATVIIALILRFAFLRIKDKNELKIERLKLKQQEELSQSKMQFFTNISHEFRTPLTLIIGPLEQMQAAETDSPKRESYRLMLRNINRLLGLINQILDLRKIEMGKMKIMVQPIELVSYVKESLGLFTDLAKRKKISLSYKYETDEMEVWFDPDLLDKSIRNLLSNAFKFTPDKGKIEVTLKQQAEYVLLQVKDNGCGIEQTEIEHIFERFYQGERSTEQTGSGIGLHLVKNIVEQHGATLRVDSEVGEGSTFSILIKRGKSHFSPEKCTIIPDRLSGQNNNEEEPIPENKIEITTGKKDLILLVEDEDDMRQYIRVELEKKYNVVEAINGKEALNKINLRMPDLVITDVMMPEMNGMELCKTLKSNLETCHIPVIILTALGDMEHKLDGLETGADSYIPKPFQARHLHIRIQKLLELRRLLKEKFNRLLNLEAHEVETRNPDEVLLKKAIDFIRENLQEPELSVNEMGVALNMSRTSLQRKIKAMTGMNPVELIKTVRMKQAAYLLETGNLSISEVAYMVGYSTPSYFSTSFSAYFGKSPKEYIKQTL